MGGSKASGSMVGNVEIARCTKRHASGSMVGNVEIARCTKRHASGSMARNVEFARSAQASRVDILVSLLEELIN